MAHSPGICVVQSKDRGGVARLNKVCQLVPFFADELVPDSISQPYLCTRINADLVKNAGKDYEHVHNRMFVALEAFAGEPIFCDKAVDMTVSLNFRRFVVWRRLQVPMKFTFVQLHRAIQASFCWMNFHLYEFRVPMGKDGIVSIEGGIDEIDALMMDDPTLSASATTLAEVLMDATEFHYIYDLGDHWEHRIKINGIVEDYAKNHPICLMGEGDAPPDDAGGVDGYLYFLEVLSDAKHPERENLLRWCKGQWNYKPFDIPWINFRLAQNKIGDLHPIGGA